MTGYSPEITNQEGHIKGQGNCLICFKMISFWIILCLSLLGPCTSLKRDHVSFVRYFVKDWKGYDSVNIFSCPDQLNVSDLFLLNNHLILFRYIDMSRPINTRQMDKDQNCRQVYVIDLKCPQSLGLIQKFSEEKIFSTFCRSVLLVDTYQDDSWFVNVFEAILQEIELTVTSDVIYATKFPINGTVSDEDINQRENWPEFYLYDVW